MSDYFTERNKLNTEKLYAMRAELPLFCSEFFMGIEPRTTVLTRLNYAYDLKNFLAFLSESKFEGKPVTKLTLADMDEVNVTDIELYLDYLTYRKNEKGKVVVCNERAKMRHLCVVRSLFKYFFAKDKLKANIAVKVALPKLHEKEIVRLDNVEVADILTLAEDGTQMTARQRAFHEKTRYRDLAILSLFLGTGIRISELAGLSLEDINLKSRSFRVVRKGGNTAVLYFPQEVAQDLEEWLLHRDCLLPEKSKETALFISLQGRRICVRAIQELVKKYARIISPLKKITPHKLRSTFGTELYRKTRDIYVVAEVLGHRDVNTTKKHYAAISEDVRRSAAEQVTLRKPRTD